VDEYILGGGRRTFLVGQQDEVAGLLTLHTIKKIPRDEWPRTPVERAMIPFEQMKSIRPEAEVWTALEKMDRDGVNQLPVMSGKTLVGLLTRDSIITYLSALQELSK
jgi:CBS domain-containing protein